MRRLGRRNARGMARSRRDATNRNGSTFLSHARHRWVTFRRVAGKADERGGADRDQMHVKTEVSRRSAARQRERDGGTGQLNEVRVGQRTQDIRGARTARGQQADERDAVHGGECGHGVARAGQRMRLHIRV